MSFKINQKQTMIEIYQSQLTSVTFWAGLGELLFLERSTLMIDDSKKDIPWSHVFKKCNNNRNFIDVVKEQL